MKRLLVAPLILGHRGHGHPGTSRQQAQPHRHLEVVGDVRPEHPRDDAEVETGRRQTQRDDPRNDGKENATQQARLQGRRRVVQGRPRAEWQQGDRQLQRKSSGDTIKGKIEVSPAGKAQSRDWEAKRAKD